MKTGGSLNLCFGLLVCILNKKDKFNLASLQHSAIFEQNWVIEEIIS